MKKSFLVSIVALLMIVAAMAFAQVTPDQEITLTTTIVDPEVKARITDIELHGLATATPSARICYSMIRVSGNISRSDCFAVINLGPVDASPSSLNAMLATIAPRTSTAQPALPVQRFMGRVASWSGSIVLAATATTATAAVTTDTTATALRTPTRR